MDIVSEGVSFACGDRKHGAHDAKEKPMPWLVKASVVDGQSVSKEYVPDISDIRGDIEDIRLSAYIKGTRKLTLEELARVPKRLLVGKNSRGDVPAILGWSTGPFIVNERVREIIEELEPGVQQFLPITVRAKDGKAIKGKPELPYYIILQPPVLDCIDFERTTWGDHGTGFEAFQKYKRLSEGDKARITLRRSCIARHHFWRAADPLHYNFFCSDELRSRLRAEKLRGWSIDKECHVSDT